jgi:acetylornithine/succinyldiaminopimelate/putrescine aminotransferase
MVGREEKAKAAFLTEYRELCERHGYMVIRIENSGEYWAFSLANLEPQMMDIAVQEMLLEPVRKIVHED